MSLSARVLGIITRPRVTLQEVVSHPQWALLLLVLTMATAAAGALALSTEVGQQALVDQWERTALAFGRPVDDGAYAGLQRWSHDGPAFGVLTALARGPLLSLAVATALFMVLRRKAPQVSFRQVCAVVVHAGVILALERLIAAPLVYMRETTASATTLGLWFSTLDEASPVARFLGSIDLFVLWWAVVLGIGLALLYGFRARTSALAVISLYVGLAIATAATMAAAGLWSGAAA